MILLALCLIQASADNYYYKIKYYDENGNLRGWTGYIEVRHENGNYVNGLKDLIDGKTVTDEKGGTYTLPKTADNKGDKDKIYGIVFANGEGRYQNGQFNILEGDEWNTWKDIRSHIKQLELREYIRDTYTGGSGYFMDMSNLEKLELPKNGMNVGTGDEDCQYYFANAHKLNTI